MTHRIRTFTLLALICSALSALAQPPDTLWTREYPAQWVDAATSFDTTFDGGSIMCGYIADDPNSDFDAIIRKVDSLGRVRWERRYGTVEGSEVASDILQASDSSFVTVGDYSSSLGMGIFVLKYRSNGGSVWRHLVEADVWSHASSVTESPDGGYLVAGEKDILVSTSTDARVVKLSRDGEELWTRFFSRGPFYGLDVSDIEGTADGGFILACHAQLLFHSDPTTLFVVRADATGELVWTREYANPYGSLRAVSVCRTEDNGYLFSCQLVGEWSYAYLLWMDDTGDTLSSRIYSAFQVRVVAVSGGGFICCGDSGDRMDLRRLTSSGDVLWATQYGYRPDVYGGVLAKPVRDGGYLALILRMNLDNGTFPTGLVRYGPDSAEDGPFRPAVPSDMYLWDCYPNPFNDGTTIRYTLSRAEVVTLKVFDLTGRELATLADGLAEPGTHSVPFHPTGLGSGLYIYRLEAPGQSQARKMVLLK